MKNNTKSELSTDALEAEKDLLELADISTDKQLEDIKAGKLKKKKNERSNKKTN